MNHKRTFILIDLLLIIVMLSYVAYCWYSGYLTPLVREKINMPLYTIGNKTFSESLQKGKKKMKVGPLPGNFYTGSIAFNQINDARQYLIETRKIANGWRIYQLSGDFTHDTYFVNGKIRTNKALLVIKDVTAENDST